MNQFPISCHKTENLLLVAAKMLSSLEWEGINIIGGPSSSTSLASLFLSGEEGTDGTTYGKLRRGATERMFCWELMIIEPLLSFAFWNVADDLKFILSKLEQAKSMNMCTRQKTKRRMWKEFWGIYVLSYGNMNYQLKIFVRWYEWSNRHKDEKSLPIDLSVIEHHKNLQTKKWVRWSIECKEVLGTPQLPLKNNYLINLMTILWHTYSLQDIVIF